MQRWPGPEIWLAQGALQGQGPARSAIAYQRLNNTGSRGELKAPASQGELAAPLPEATFHFDGHRVRASLGKAGVTLGKHSGCPLPLPPPSLSLPATVPYDEILSASQVERARFLPSPCSSPGHSLIIHTFRRSARKKCLWRPHQLVLNCQDRALAQEWAAEINAITRRSPRRPRTLLVLLNPFGGVRKARSVWRDIALPVFELAGVKCVTVETERLGHARQIIMHLTSAEVSSYDGIVAVGGDGLFQEALNGLLLLRARSPELGDLAARMRLGHIPAGSTDAVAYSLNGTRSELTAALHVALGDRMPLDVMRIDTKDGLYRFAVCVASYGYMGDLMQRSEDMRWLGPSRYNLAGALVLFQNRSYEAKVSWLAAAQRRNSVCGFQCSVCALPTPHRHDAADHVSFTQTSRLNLQEGQWHTRAGSYKSIMAIVTPCRSDQSTLGLAPYSHLSDGRIQLVLVKECSILQYLQFLASIPQSGVVPGKFSYVDIVEATAVHVEPVGKESRWNVDGELLETNHVNAQVHRGLVEAFARGVEL